MHPMTRVLVQCARSVSRHVLSILLARVGGGAPRTSRAAPSLSGSTPSTQTPSGLLLGGMPGQIVTPDGTSTPATPLLADPSAHDHAQQCWRHIGMAANQSRMAALGAHVQLTRAQVEHISMCALRTVAQRQQSLLQPVARALSGVDSLKRLSAACKDGGVSAQSLAAGLQAAQSVLTGVSF